MPSLLCCREANSRCSSELADSSVEKLPIKMQCSSRSWYNDSFMFQKLLGLGLPDTFAISSLSKNSFMGSQNSLLLLAARELAAPMH